MKTKIFVAGAITLAAITLMAQDAPKSMSKAAKGGILHPEMTVLPENGTWDKPMAKIGTKPDAAWTQTTTAAGVNSQPQPGKPVTMVGEIVDFSCYIQLGKHGDKHRSCGQKCVQNGQPIGLLTKTGDLYMLMPEEHDPRRDGGVDARASAADHMAHIVEITGTEASVNGYKAIFVQGLTK